MTAVDCLTHHNTRFGSSFDSNRAPMDFDNNSDYMIGGFQNAFSFDGEPLKPTSTTSSYPTDPLLFNANNRTSNGGDSASLFDNLIKDNDNIGIKDEESDANYQMSGSVQQPHGLLSPEMQPRVTRQTRKKMSQKVSETAIPPNPATKKKKESKPRRQSKRESVAKSSTSAEASASTSAAGTKSSSKKTNRRDRSLERNRIAASKCRKRKKQWTDNLETKKSGLEAHNKNLHAQYIGLVEEASQLKNMLITHAGCNDPNIDVWVENEATKYVRKLSNPQGVDQQGTSFSESVSHLQDSLLRHHSTSTQITEPSQDAMSPDIDAEGDDIDTDDSLGSDFEDEIEAKQADDIS